MSVRDALFTQALQGATLQRGTPGDGAAKVDGEGFSNALLDAIRASDEAEGASASKGDASPVTAFISDVDMAQKVADKQAERLASGEGNVHETAIALEKADIQIRLLMKGRDKAVQAYQEIMRMTV